MDNLFFKFTPYDIIIVCRFLFQTLLFPHKFYILKLWVKYIFGHLILM